jgi:transposase-like protein
METVEKKLGCQTLIRIESDGTKVYKDKVKFETLDEAIEECKKLNALPHRINKIVSYKCKHCHKYHVGRNGKEISTKYSEKLKAEQYKPTVEDIEERRRINNIIDFENANFNIVGKIDLDKVPKK